MQTVKEGVTFFHFCLSVKLEKIRNHHKRYKDEYFDSHASERRKIMSLSKETRLEKA